MFGIEQTAQANNSLRPVLEDLFVSGRNLVMLREKAAENIVKAQVANENAYDVKRKSANIYDVGVNIIIGVSWSPLPRRVAT